MKIFTFDILKIPSRHVRYDFSTKKYDYHFKNLKNGIYFFYIIYEYANIFNLKSFSQFTVKAILSVCALKASTFHITLV